MEWDDLGDARVRKHGSPSTVKLSAGMEIGDKRTTIVPLDVMPKRRSSHSASYAGLLDVFTGVQQQYDTFWDIARKGEVALFPEVYMELVQDHSSGKRGSSTAPASEFLCYEDSRERLKPRARFKREGTTSPRVGAVQRSSSRLGDLLATKEGQGSFLRLPSFRKKARSTGNLFEGLKDEITSGDHGGANAPVEAEATTLAPAPPILMHICESCLITGEAYVCSYCAEHCHANHRLGPPTAVDPSLARCSCGTHGHQFSISIGGNSKKPIDSHCNGRTALSLAAENNHMDMIQLLLSYQADPNASDSCGATPLLRACGQGHTAVVKTLLHAGAAIDCKETMTGLTMLHLACQSGDLELVEMLEHRQDPNAVTAKGETPLYFAASRGYREIVEHLLLSNDCDLDTATTDGRTAIQAALQRGDVATVAILLHKGAHIMTSDHDLGRILPLVPVAKVRAMRDMLFREACALDRPLLLTGVIDELHLALDAYMTASCPVESLLLNRDFYEETGPPLMVAAHICSRAGKYSALLALLKHKDCPCIRNGVEQKHLMNVNDIEVLLQVVAMQASPLHRIRPSLKRVIALERAGLTSISELYVEALRQYNTESSNPVKLLVLKHNSLRSIPTALWSVPKLRDVNLDDNPLEFIPEEYRKSWQKLRGYLKGMEARAERWKKSKIVVLGSKDSGKTTLVHALVSKKGKAVSRSIKVPEAAVGQAGGVTVLKDLVLSTTKASMVVGSGDSKSSPLGSPRHCHEETGAEEEAVAFDVWDIGHEAANRGAHRLLVHHSAVILIAVNMASAVEAFKSQTNFVPLGPSTANSRIGSRDAFLASVEESFETLLAHSRSSAHHIVIFVGTHTDLIVPEDANVIDKVVATIQQRFPKHRYHNVERFQLVNTRNGEGISTLKELIRTKALATYFKNASPVPGTWIQLHDVIHDSNVLSNVCRDGINPSLAAPLLDAPADAANSPRGDDLRLLDLNVLTKPLLANVAAQCGISDRDQFVAASLWLVRSGSMLLFKLPKRKSSYRDLIVLSPLWVGKLLESVGDGTAKHMSLRGQGTGTVQDGVLNTHEDVSALFQAYNPRLVPSLVALLEKFHLLMLTNNIVDVPAMTMPLRPPEIPLDTLQRAWELAPRRAMVTTFTENDNECSRVYQFPTSPAGVLYSSAVHLLRLPGSQCLLSWSNGLVMELSGEARLGLSGLQADEVKAKALLILDPATKRLYVTVRNAKRALMDVLFAVNTVIDTSYRLKSEVQRLVPCSHCITSSRETPAPNESSALQKIIDEYGSIGGGAVVTAMYERCYFFTYKECTDLISSNSAQVFCHNVKSPSRKVAVAHLAPDIAFCGIPLIHPSQLVKTKVLGKGSFGTVHQASVKPIVARALHRESSKMRSNSYQNVQVAVKELNMSDITESEDVMEALYLEFQAEVFVMSKLQHPNLVRLCGVCLAPSLQMVLELLPEGNLFELLHPEAPSPSTGVVVSPGNEKASEQGSEELPMIPEEKFSWRLRLLIALDIARGMAVLQNHDPPIVHRDLRSPNVFLASLSTNISEIRAKVADFGLARVVPDGISEVLECWQWCSSFFPFLNP